MRKQIFFTTFFLQLLHLNMQPKNFFWGQIWYFFRLLQTWITLSLLIISLFFKAALNQAHLLVSSLTTAGYFFSIDRIVFSEMNYLQKNQEFHSLESFFVGRNVFLDTALNFFSYFKESWYLECPQKHFFGTYGTSPGPSQIINYIIDQLLLKRVFGVFLPQKTK